MQNGSTASAEVARIRRPRRFSAGLGDGSEQNAILSRVLDALMEIPYRERIGYKTECGENEISILFFDLPERLWATS